MGYINIEFRKVQATQECNPTPAMSKPSAYTISFQMMTNYRIYLAQHVIRVCHGDRHALIVFCGVTLFLPLHRGGHSLPPHRGGMSPGRAACAGGQPVAGWQGPAPPPLQPQTTAEQMDRASCCQSQNAWPASLHNPEMLCLPDLLNWEWMGKRIRDNILIVSLQRPYQPTWTPCSRTTTLQMEQMPCLLHNKLML